MDICFVLSRVKFPTSMNSETQGVAVFRIRIKKILQYSVHAMFATRGIHFPATDQNSGDNRLRFFFCIYKRANLFPPIPRKEWQNNIASSGDSRWNEVQVEDPWYLFVR
ncbi:hypothetical protein CEXT_256541 [Caerostris extrusa]|uniref:Ycf15 n=1 Tax=Caerostris extrusa TaxID=172846 RepID=A0AAV4RB16_CAEEX|nr:hypothetical protein CEXT_256541 [Caerostris extrusa]